MGRVTVLRDGLLDDAVRGERWDLVLRRRADGLAPEIGACRSGRLALPRHWRQCLDVGNPSEPPGHSS